jgi:signal transduction histidine kinase
MPGSFVPTDGTDARGAARVPEVMFAIHDHWHGWSSDPVATVSPVESRADERLSASAGLVATVAVGVGALFAGPDDSLASGPVSAVMWWVAYGVYLGAFVLDADLVTGRPAWVTRRRLLAVQIVAAAVAWLVSPGLGWSAVLFVVTAATAAYILPARGASAVVVLQSGFVALGTALDGQTATEVVLATAIYGSFQGFAVLVARSEQRAVDAKAELAAAHAELAAAHAELRAASVLLATSTRTAERLRISRELHDVVGHQLTALALELEVASHHRDGETAAHVDRARTIAKELLRDVREAVGELRGGTADLEATLRELVSDLPGLTVTLTVEERRPLTETQTLAIVRCVQEVLTNALRHAEAENLTISVVADETGVRLDARDDGLGVAQLTPGHGLTGLRERIEELGGEVTLRTAPGRGFTVSARVPVA